MKLISYLKKHTTIFELLALTFVIFFLVACGGGSTSSFVNSTSSNITNTVVISPIVYTAGDKNSGGITYTSGDGSLLDKTGDDIITNTFNIPDRVLLGINNMFPGSDASSSEKRNVLIEYSRFFTSILSLTNENLPRSKIEAESVFYSNLRKQNFCKFENTFSNFEIEEILNRTYLMNLYSKEKLLRYSEIRNLAKVKLINC